MRSTNASLGSGFRSLFAGSLISNTGDGIRLAALPLLAAQVTSSPLLISSVTAAQFLPWVTVAPAGGVFVDRWNRRRTILITQAWRGVVMACLALLVLADVVAIWQLCVVAFLITAGEILVDPSIVALVPTIVDDEHLDTANGRIASVEIVTNDVAGGPIGAAAFGVAPWLPFLIDGVSYLGSVVPFSRLPRTVSRDEPPAARSKVSDEAREGFRWLRRHPVLGPLTAATVLYYFGASAGISLLVVMVTDELGSSATGFGTVLAVGAVAAFVGSLTGSRLARAIGPRAILSAMTLVQGAAMIAMSMVTSVWGGLVVWFVHGLPAGARIPVARSMQQRLTPNHLLGRVNVSSRVFTRGVLVVGAVMSGSIATAVGVRWSFAIGGVIEVLAAGATWWALGRGSGSSIEND